MSPTHHFRSGCPIASALDVVGDRWSLVIVRTMMMGARSYADLSTVPERIATNILADRLKRLTESGIIRQARPSRGTARGVYVLTETGAELLPVLQALAKWGGDRLEDRWRPPERFWTMTPADVLAKIPDD